MFSLNFIGGFISSSDLSLKSFLCKDISLRLSINSYSFFFKIIIASNTPSLSGQVHDAFFFHLSGNPKNHSCVLCIEFKLEHRHCERHQELRSTVRRTQSCFSPHSRSQVMWQSLGCLHCLCFCFLAFTSSGSLPIFFFPDYTKSWILRSLTGVMKLVHMFFAMCSSSFPL